MMHVATALTVYGIETQQYGQRNRYRYVATALTVYGIETSMKTAMKTIFTTLQQHLPFTVLKLIQIKQLVICGW